MAASPRYKIYSADGKYVASCHYAEDAAILVGIGYADGGTVRFGHGKILWTNGVDGLAAESYDGTAAVIYERERAMHQKSYDRAYGDCDIDGATSVPGFGSISL